MAVSFKNSKTKVNLMRAFAGESQARNRYEFAAAKCKKAQFWFLYNVFTLTANQEKEHAEIFYNLLKSETGSNISVDTAKYPVDNVDDPIGLLRAAVKNETEEAEDVYPSFAETAREEGFNDIAYTFDMIAKIEAVHAERFECFAKLLEGAELFSGTAETEWICLNCGHIHKGQLAPKTCPVCQHAQGYFVPFKYYQFIAEKYSLPCPNDE
jgi:rubrerythrin